MSKVKITGHASGSGTLTLSAPNTSSDRTLTLPDETATLSTFDPDGAVTINDTGADVDFRVESNTHSHHFFIDSGDNNVSINLGVSSPELRALPGGTATGLQVKGSDGDKSAIAITRHSADAPGAALRFLKSRNTTVNSYTAVVNNDDIGSIEFYADDGTDYAHMGAQIIARMNGTPGANDLPAELIFLTTAEGANTPTEHLAIKEDGRGVSSFTARAWADFDQATVNASHNVTSVTDNGTGNYSINYTNNMGSVNYAVSGLAETAGNVSVWAQAVGSCSIRTDNSASGAYTDYPAAVIVFGD